MHDMPCPIHREEPAVLNLGDGIFHPSWKAQREGWMLIKPPRWIKWLLKKCLKNSIGKRIN